MYPTELSYSVTEGRILMVWLINECEAYICTCHVDTFVFQDY